MLWPPHGHLRFVSFHCTVPSWAAEAVTAGGHTCSLKGDSLFSSLLGDANRQISDYKFKLSKAEQDITTLEQNVSTSSVCYQVTYTPFETSASGCLTPGAPRFLWAASTVGSSRKPAERTWQDTSAFC